ncbi:5162_t:CDS:2 [Funneliformis geosporum]|uniref:18313_t:CDS:1 n=1 Tax=Funneliformis geosporum TaxID=1117311 RepID=A0A9W4SLX0_9GLOM|nr:5162_t:CDS:2 [Funneliformis geosporum]CAI2173879.1 18313_t:CDS:2 [Funneliformis geosporum]
MATYKQKPRVQHHVANDSEEISGTEQDWVMFNSARASNQPIERRLVNVVSDDEDWHVLSDNTNPVEEGIPSLESNSEFASGGSDCDSEPYYLLDQTARSIELLPEGQGNSPSQMPSHDGTGNFFDTKLSDESNHVSTSLVESEILTSRDDLDNEPTVSDQNGSVNTDKTSQDYDSIRPMGSSIRETLMSKVRNVFRIEEEVVSAINSQEQAHSNQIYHKFAESASSAAKFELGDLGNTNPIKSLANVGDENTNSTTYTTVTTQYIDTLPNQTFQENHSEKLPKTRLFDSSSPATSTSSIHRSNVVDGSITEKNASILTRFDNKLIVQKDPIAMNFTPTISNDMLNEIMISENSHSADHQNQQSTASQISSQSNRNSLLSTVWTTFCRITNNIIISDDTDPTHGDLSQTTIFASSNYNNGLASIITGTGENHYTYDSCHFPFGNHLALSELCPSLYNYTSSSSTPSTPSYHKKRNSIATSSNTARIFLTPVSSSTSLKSFTSRAGSDCGLESRVVRRSITLEAPLVL